MTFKLPPKNEPSNAFATFSDVACQMPPPPSSVDTTREKTLVPLPFPPHLLPPIFQSLTCETHRSWSSSISSCSWIGRCAIVCGSTPPPPTVGAGWPGGGFYTTTGRRPARPGDWQWWHFFDDGGWRGKRMRSRARAAHQVSVWVVTWHRGQLEVGARQVELQTTTMESIRTKIPARGTHLKLGWHGLGGWWGAWGGCRPLGGGGAQLGKFQPTVRHSTPSSCSNSPPWSDRPHSTSLSRAPLNALVCTSSWPISPPFVPAAPSSSEIARRPC
jgi:hypothetical protein